MPITPMLDMAFQLLTFFVFTYHPSAYEGQIQMSLPAADLDGGLNKPDQVFPSDPTIPSPTELTVIIKTKPEPNTEPVPSRYLVERPEGPSPEMSSLAELEIYLVSAKKDLKNVDDVQIKADGRLKYKFVVDVMEVCTDPARGGFKRVNFSLGTPSESN